MLSESDISNTGDVYDYADDVHTDQFKSIMETTFYDDQGECDFSNSSSEDKGKPVFSFWDELKKGAIASNTPISYVSSLLSILRNYFPDLPKDGPTLLCTPNNFTVQK